MDDELAQRYRREAERLRHEAKAMTNPCLRQQLLDVAVGYDALAKTILWMAETALDIARERDGLLD